MEIKRYLVLVLVIAGLCSVQAETPGSLITSVRQANQKARIAHNAAEYHELATFYRRQETSYQLQAREQRNEYKYALSHWSTKSYPQAADRARQLADYYQQRAEQSKGLAEAFEAKLDTLNGAGAALPESNR